MIREYQETDLEDLLDAWAAASAIATPFLSEEFLAGERRNIRDLYLPNAETWVLEKKGHVVGFTALIGNEVGALFVHPDHHGRGLGRALMNKARELRGELVVQVFTENRIGCRFYTRYGFEPTGVKVHEETGYELTLMRLPA